MKLRVFIICIAVMFAFGGHAYAWGPKGHDIIAYIAECNLKPKAKRSVTQALEGHSMMYYSSWLNNVRDLPEYKHTKTWHYANVDEGKTYETMPKEADGDIITALTFVIDELQNKCNTLTRQQELDYVRFLVHLIGDLHCPMHAGRLSDRGGNNFKIRWFGSPTSLHSLWDSTLIESIRKWSYTEWRNNIDILSDTEKKAMSKGNFMDWFRETVEICKYLYDTAEEDQNYSWDYMLRNYPVLELQLQRGGYWLAALHNSIY